jgi:DNA-directed RNA polymerase specialized sigma24 family protein
LKNYLRKYMQNGKNNAKLKRVPPKSLPGLGENDGKIISTGISGTIMGQGKVKSEPDRTQRSFIFMTDGRVQGLLPYSYQKHTQDQLYPYNEEDRAGVQDRLDLLYMDNLAKLGKDLPRVFSYHLAWCGDVAQAQRLCEKTVGLCRQHISGFHPGKIPPAVWILRMARHTRLRAQEREPADLQDMTSMEEELASLPDISKLGLLSQELGRMPAATAEALVLTCFAGLNPEEAGGVLGIKAAQLDSLDRVGLKQMLGNTVEKPGLPFQFGEVAGVEIILEGLAQAIQPDPAWMEGVRQRLVSILPHRYRIDIGRVLELALFLVGLSAYLLICLAKYLFIK